MEKHRSDFVSLASDLLEMSEIIHKEVDDIIRESSFPPIPSDMEADYERRLADRTQMYRRRRAEQFAKELRLACGLRFDREKENAPVK